MNLIAYNCVFVDLVIFRAVIGYCGDDIDKLLWMVRIADVACYFLCVIAFSHLIQLFSELVSVIPETTSTNIEATEGQPSVVRFS